MELTILGSGTSTGVPVLGCRCPVCSSDDPKDHRSRASVRLKVSGLSILFDTATEFRLQALAAGIRHIDAVFLTHAHADHVHGLDDLRPLSHHQPIPVYGSPATLREVGERFAYIFMQTPAGTGKPKITLEPITSAQKVSPRRVVGAADAAPGNEEPASSVEVQPVPLLHGSLPIYGYRVGSFAYLTDCSKIPEESFSLLDGVRVVVIDALRFRAHPTHFNVEEAVSAVRRMGAETAYFTHLCHEVSYRELLAALPEGIFPAYDGLVHRI